MSGVSDAQATALGAAVLVVLVSRLPPWGGVAALALGTSLALARGALVGADLVFGALWQDPVASGLVVLLALAAWRLPRWRRCLVRGLLAVVAARVAVVVGAVDALVAVLENDHSEAVLGLCLGALAGGLAGPLLALSWTAQAGGSGAAVGSALLAGLLSERWLCRAADPPQGSPP